MKRISRQGQSGYALILLVLALMGVGGVVIAGYTQGAKQQTEHQQYLHNERVLKEAKQALLQYAYNYPVNNSGRGPGRLPCPDTDNDGSPNSSFNCISGSAMVGRFPWNDDGMDFYDARDASGSRLWYAVSQNFANSISPTVNDVINSDTQGTITVADVSGAILHDATSTPSSGVVAVIIAPGPAIDRNGTRQDRSVANSDDRFDTTADSDPGIVDPVNYLDIYGTVDNADFINNNANGFITGPIRNRADGSLALNDQMIVVTAAEVAAMAEKATLQAYRNAILDYLGPGRANGVYPWLFNYAGITTVAELDSKFPLDSDFVGTPNYHDNYGRIPALFGNYFAANDSQPIETTLEATLTIDYLNRIVTDTGGGNLEFASTQPFLQTLTLPVPGTLTNVHFEDSGGGVGRLSTNLPALQIYTVPLYFWKGSHGDPPGEWILCTDVNGNGFSEISDCDTGIELEILRVEFQVFIPAGVGFDIDYSVAPSIAVDAATAGKHAYITATVPGSSLVLGGSNTPGISASYQIDRHLHFESGDSFSVEETGNLTVADLLSGDTELSLKMLYYPELPIWAFDNGWHNAIRMAYADTYKPGVPVDCVPLPDGDPTNDCLFLPDEQGARRDIASLLVIAGEHDWVDENSDGMADELRDVFDDGNQNNNLSFSTARGNDELLIIAEP